MERNMIKFLREKSEPATNVPYREAIGSILYFTMCIRPDISYAVGVLSQYYEQPKVTHWTMLKRILRYLKGTVDAGIVFGARGSRTGIGQFEGYADTDWAGLPSRKSTSGSLLFYDGCLISWKSRYQLLVAMSTTEAEIIGVVEA